MLQMIMIVMLLAVLAVGLWPLFLTLVAASLLGVLLCGAVALVITVMERCGLRKLS